MREFSTPGTDLAPVTGNLTDDLARQAEQAPDTVLVCRWHEPDDGTPGWRDVTAAELWAEVRAVARGLIAAGVEVGDRVALMSRTRYEWTLLDYAIWCCGAVTVPVYESSSAEQVHTILTDSGAVAIIVEHALHAGRVAEQREGLAQLRHVWSIDTDTEVPGDSGGVVRELCILGAEVDDPVVDERRASIGPDDVASLIYTSGTTGRPKGCMLTHGAFLAEVDVTTRELAELFEPDDARTLLFLPLAHVLARIVQIGCVRTGTPLAHSAGFARIGEDLRSFEPTFVLGVPRVFERLFNAASQQATADGRGRLFDRAAEVAIAYSRGLDAGRVPVRVRAQRAALGRVLEQRMHGALGGRCRWAVSGGAPLGERLTHFYRGLGLTVLEGYGLTETTASICSNVPDALKIGTVGRPLPGAAVRVADDGELLFRGPQVFSGYWQDPEATAEVLERDGWLHSGDIGEVDDEGFVRITGRKKEIIVTAGGKNVAPGVLEERLRTHPLIDQCVVVGDGQPYVAALITLDVEALRLWAGEHDALGGGTRVKDLDDDELLALASRDTAVRAAVQTGVDAANQAVSKAEAVRRFVVLPRRWTEDDGQLTPSLKLKRRVVLRESHDEIEALYV
ncbi:AMP-dependent synthetase/ligase [Nocardioides acrostichi]|uniref:AMP-binding protein n=1 Tax=Nocardioides acrostichi TaxID=2784339 RepID=A0A930Y645_9ACTN|nr:AMP-dependent synthetase/ligase [Nocardioides acrostichi]MBF4160567.1 AMP-binding protein [Nocardioides acrostichi]